MKKFIVGAVVLLFMLICTVVVVFSDDSQGGNIPPPPNKTMLVKTPDKEILDVYFDASVSMAGYTTIAADNIYRELPDELSSIGSSMGEVNFFRFGEQIFPVEGMDYRQYSNTGVYTELSNSVKNVVAAADPNHLTVIVTDLFETDTAWSAVAQGIKEKYFSKRMAVAVMGMKNPFNGRIYDVGLNQQAFDYSSNSDKAKYRPFYILAMGPEKHVNDFLKRCKDKEFGHDFKFVKMSSNLMDEPKSILDTEGVEVENVYAETSISLPEEEKAAQYSINSLDEPITLTQRFVYVPDSLGCAMDMSKVVPNVSLHYLQENVQQEKGFFDTLFGDDEPEQQAEVVETKWIGIDSSKLTCTITAVEGQENTYDVAVKFMPRDVLKTGYVNYLNINIAPTYDGFVLPDWIRAWNMSNAVAGDPSQFDGAKTANLFRTIDSLKDSVLKAGNPSIVNMNIYFNLRNRN